MVDGIFCKEPLGDECMQCQNEVRWNALGLRADFECKISMYMYHQNGVKSVTHLALPHLKLQQKLDYHICQNFPMFSHIKSIVRDNYVRALRKKEDCSSEKLTHLPTKMVFLEELDKRDV